MPDNLLGDRLVTRLTGPFIRFSQLQAASGAVLLGATLIALAIANSSLSADYNDLLARRFTIGFDTNRLSYPLWYWVNDGLMAIFFFIIGLEIKRELTWGELRDRRNVVLPVCAAIGGALAPIGIYLALQQEPPGRSGWAVPMATDIAFVIGCLSVLGKRVPAALKVFVLSLAIIDDLLGVIVIASAFSAKINIVALALSMFGAGSVVVLNRIGVRSISVYAVVGVAIWVCTLKSGIHPTIAGVVLGLLTPADALLRGRKLDEAIENAATELRKNDDEHSAERQAAAATLSLAATESLSPLERLEHALHPWVAFAIMPIFALVNAGVSVSVSGITEPISLAVIAGLVAGKPVGILLACGLAIKLGVARLPSDTSWGALVGAACLAGIGFTMALFIASLSLDGAALATAKTGILIGSALSMVCGMAVLAIVLPRTQQ